MDKIKLYIDKENIKSFVHSRRNKENSFIDCTNIISKNIDIHYNFSKEEIKQDPDIELWFRHMYGQGVDNNHKFSDSEDEISPIRPISFTDFTDGNEDPFGIYLLDDKDACLDVKIHNCVLIGEVGKELEVLQKLLDINDLGEFFVKDITWENFCPQLPLTDIVLVDNYYFKTPKVYKKNENTLLRVLASIPKKSPVYVVIIARASDISCDLKLDDELENIRYLVQEASDCKDSSVTIAGIEDEIHDRVLITNYYRINSSSGFMKQKRVKNDLRLDIRSHAKKNDYNNSWELINNSYQKAIKNAKFCIGDKISNYIDFDF
ncbi:MAG: hypothetical protein U0K66_07490 [Paludibacteraceae bacterium]|nr:hypothetical protein [Paludibacteraceae bacterium]